MVLRRRLSVEGSGRKGIFLGSLVSGMGCGADRGRSARLGGSRGPMGERGYD